MYVHCLMMPLEVAGHEFATFVDPTLHLRILLDFWTIFDENSKPFHRPQTQIQNFGRICG